MAFLSTRWNPHGDGNTGHGHTTNLSKRNPCCWLIAGLIPYFKIGRAVWFRKSGLDTTAGADADIMKGPKIHHPSPHTSTYLALMQV